MLRLTADLLARSPVFVNTLNDRELDLRGENDAGCWFVEVQCSYALSRRQPAAGD